MARQTASDAIDEAVKTHRIFRHEGYKGKQKIVLFDYNQDVLKVEKMLLAEVEMSIKNFDIKFSIFKEKYPRLSLDEKAEGVDKISYLMRSIVVLANQLQLMFGQTRKWVNLYKEIVSRAQDFVKLASQTSKIEVSAISIIFHGQLCLDVLDAFSDVETYLNKIEEK